MKIATLTVFILLLFGCENYDMEQEDLPDFQILTTELIDFMPYIALTNGVDTLYEVISEGEIGITKKGDTLHRLINVSDTIYSELNSIMCCRNKYFFKDKLVVYEENFSDYLSIHKYAYLTSGSLIYRIDTGAFSDTTIFNIIDNQIRWKVDLSDPSTDTTHYYYENGFLVKQLTTDTSMLRNTHTKDFVWNTNNNSIATTIYTSRNIIHITHFDESGIPLESTTINYDSTRSDTVYKTKWTSPSLVR